MRELIRHIIQKHVSQLFEQRLGKDEFIKRANNIHGDRYDYSEVEYVNNQTPVKIYCREHGLFNQRPANHIQGKQGCPKCGLKKLKTSQNMTEDEFLTLAEIQYGNEFNYSEVKFIDNNTKVKIICPKHGPFLQTPRRFLKGINCQKCALEKSAKNRTFWTKEEIIKEIPKHNSISEFQKNAIGAYVAAVKNGWWEEMKKNFVLKKNLIIQPSLSTAVCKSFIVLTKTKAQDCPLLPFPDIKCT